MDDTLACLKSGADPADSLFPYGWGVVPASLVEPLCIGPEVEPPARRSKSKRRRRQKRLSADDAQRLTLQALKRYRDHAARLSGRHHVGRPDADTNQEWIGTAAIALQLSGCAKAVAEEATVLAAKRLAEQWVRVDVEGAKRVQVVAPADADAAVGAAVTVDTTARLLQLLPDTSRAQSYYHDNEHFEEVLLAERCRRTEVALVRQLVERCRADIARARDVFSGRAGTLSAGACMGKVSVHMHEVMAASVGDPGTVAVPRG